MKIRVLMVTSFVVALLVACQNPTPEPTSIPLDQIDLAPIIFQKGDLPPGFEPAQVRAMTGSLTDGVPTPVNFYSLSLENNGENGGVVDILLYDNEDTTIKAYIAAANNMPGAMTKAEVGDSGTLATSFMFIDAVSLTFRRCNTVVTFQFQGTTSKDAALSYAIRIDERIQESICNR